MTRRALCGTFIAVLLILTIVAIEASTATGRQLTRSVLGVPSWSPASVALKPGGPGVTVTVSGSELDTVTEVQIIQKGIAVSGITVKWGLLKADNRTLTVAAGYAARVGTFQVRLTTKLGTVLDIPASVFAINVVPPITVTEPRAGTTWKTGEMAAISWNFEGTPPGPNVRIDLYKGGKLNYPILSSYPIGGGRNFFSWRLPLGLTEGSDYRLKVTCTANENYAGSNPGPFTIHKVPERDITLLSPVGGEDWRIGTSHAITWKHRSDPGFLDQHKVTIYLETSSPGDMAGGYRCITAQGPVPIGPAGGSSYQWLIPEDIPPGYYWVKIFDFSNWSICDISFSRFRISGPPAPGEPSGAGDR